MTRPLSLPDYGSPPLNEVVLGIQFRLANAYQQIRAGEVWGLFKDRFPIVEEQPRLPSSFETFGPVQVQRNQIEIVEGAQHDRFWFLTLKRDELIQFQSDRLLHNWRKVDGVETRYPRFELMEETLGKQALKLEAYFNSLEPQSLEINQVEATYINHFPIDEDRQFKFLSDYVRLIEFEIEPDDCTIRYRRTIKDSNGNPTGRLYCESNVGITPKGKLLLTLNLTVRGTPSDSSIGAAMSYLRNGRDMIVNEFTTITTDKAHRLWERTR